MQNEATLKILFVMYDLGSAYSPTGNILIRIASEWARQGVECHFLGPCEKDDIPKDIRPAIGHPFPVYSAPIEREDRVVPLYYAKNNNIGKKDLWRAFCSSPRFVYRQWRRYLLDQKSGRLLESYITHTQELLARESYDAVIGVYFPYQILQAFSMMDTAVPFFLYQLDPWGLHESDYPYSRRQRAQQEKRAFAKAAHIFTTPVLLSRYRRNSYCQYANKITPLEFPNLCRSSEDAADSTGEVLSPYGRPVLFFGGSIADDYRNPSYFLRVFDRFSLNCPQACLVFMGNLYSDTLSEYAKRNPGRVHMLAPGPVAQAQAMMQQADALLSIGNRFSNQMPSKLFDYISTGKPVVSTVKSHDAYTEKSLKKYPLGLCLREDEDVDGAARKLVAFLEETQDRQLSFETVEALYPENTPAFVASTLLSVIKQHLKKELSR